MEVDTDDLDNLFDEYDADDPQPQENTNSENVENDSAVPEKVPVPKRVVKHPRLKFDPERLCGKKGIPILVNHFKDVKFKGKGHEKEDLKKLLTSLELWTHRLFPSMKFEACLRQIEHLGKKRPVKTCVQKIRLDFPILDQDFVRNDDDEEEMHEQENELEPESPAQDAFDRLFDDYQERAQSIITSSPSTSKTSGNVLGTSFGSSFSEEQKKRMEYNKMLAIERRKALKSSSLVDPAASGTTKNVDSVYDSPSTERGDDPDPNFLFNYLQKQFTNTENLRENEKTEKHCSQSVQPENMTESERNEVVKSVVGDTNKMELDVLSNAKSNCTSSEELDLDELMELVDEDDINETDHNIENNECLESNCKKEVGLNESINLVEEDNQNTVNESDDDYDSLLQPKNNEEESKHEIDLNTLSNAKNDFSDNDGRELGLDKSANSAEKDLYNTTADDDENDKDGTDHDTLLDSKNNVSPENNDKERLGLDELMDLVQEDNQTTVDESVEDDDYDSLLHSKNNEKNSKHGIDLNALSNVKNDFSNNDGRELGLDKLMNLVEKDLNNTTADDRNDEDGTDHDTLLNCKNVSPENTPTYNDKEGLGLDELMEIVDKDQDAFDEGVLPLETDAMVSNNEKESKSKTTVGN